MADKKRSGKNRHKSRESALEALYAWTSGGCDNAAIPAILADRIQEEERMDQDVDYLREAVMGVTSAHEAIDSVISEFLQKRSMETVAHIERNVLRLAVWELQNRLEIPYRVIINEALELTRAYADEPARGFINGVLDKMSRSLRAQEIGASGRG